MSDYDLVIRNGTIVDGTRLPAFKADLAIKHGKIAQISGKIVCEPTSANWTPPDVTWRPARSICIAITTRKSTGTPTARSPDGTASPR